MRTLSSQFLLLVAFAIVAFFSSCDRGGAGGSAAAEDTWNAEKLDRISVSEMGKLRSRVGDEVVVYGKVAKASSSGSGHQFLNFSNGFSIVCLKDSVGKFSGGGPAELFDGKLIEVKGTLASHKGKPQIALESPSQIREMKIGGTATGASRKNFALVETVPGTWVSPAGMRYKGRDAKGLSRKDHVLRHAKDQPSRAGSHGVFDANGDAVFAVIDEAWAKIKSKNIRPKTEGGSQTYTVPMGRRVGYLGGQNGARRKKPALKKVFIVVRKGTQDVVTAFPK